MLPPRFGKSEIGSRHFPPWVLGHHPDWEIIAASHTASLTLSFSRYIRDVVRDPGYTAVFPDTRLDPSSQSVENWNLTKGGGYLAAGVGTGITGRGAHVLLLDDLVKDIEAADSQTITDGTWEWYGSTAYTRLAPGGGVLGIMTWWSEQDWAGRIQEVMKSGEGDVFEIVKYPAINDQGDEYILEDDHIVQLPPGSDIPVTARLTRPMNTAVHPDRYDTEAMLRIKRNLVATGQKRVWQALYQQDPLPDEGLFFTKDMLRYSTAQWRSDMTCYQAWDFSITEKRMSDWISCTTGWVTPDDDIIIADVLRFKVNEDGTALVEAMIDNYVLHNAAKIGVEDGQIWKSIKTLFEKRCRERRVYPSFEVLTPLTDKVVRAGPLRGRMQMGKVYVMKNRPWNEPFISELMHFPGGKHDDMVDSTSWMVRLSLQHTPKSARRMPEPKSWKDKLKTLGAGGGGHMAA
jgi:predicted phage terminase large subunit-like protein